MTERAPARRPIAPLWHTAGLIAILLVSFFGGLWLQSRPAGAGGLAPQNRSLIGVYLIPLIADWALFYYVWAPIHDKGTPLSRLVGGRWASAGDVARDFAIALPFWILWELTAQLVHRVLGPNSAKTVDSLLPRSLGETFAWILLSLTAGFCEEVVFRGYLQQQFRAWTQSAAASIALQAVLFGVAHGYQGLHNVIVITVLGALYGVLALWRRSVRPGMISHAWSDIYGGLQMRFLSGLL